MKETIEARHGAHVFLAANQRIRITTPSGRQVVDLWAVPCTPTPRWLSTAQTRQKLSRLSPRVGCTLVDTHRQPLLTLDEDTSPGIHDMLYPGCDVRRYAESGISDHASCVENLMIEMETAVAELLEHTNDREWDGLCELARKTREWDWAPEPLNLFMNVPVAAEDNIDKKKGEISVLSPMCKAGDYVVLRTEVKCLLIMSACPNDLLNTNEGRPGDATYEILS